MAVSDTLINTLFDGRYRILRKLGSGGMANVYLAEDQELGRRVAIKILNERHAGDEQFIERFRREAKNAAGLSHPNIVSIYDRGEAEGTYYIAMEYLDGRSLKELIVARGPAPIPLAIDYARQILAALRFAHRHGIVHRDIKPHNVLVDAEGRLKVTDFGIARAGASQMTEAGSIIGTAQYLSPEQAQGAPVDQALGPLLGRRRALRAADRRRAVQRRHARRDRDEAPLDRARAAVGEARRHPARPRPGRHARAREGSGGALPDRRGDGRRPRAASTAASRSRPDTEEAATAIISRPPPTAVDGDHVARRAAAVPYDRPPRTTTTTSRRGGALALVRGAPASCRRLSSAGTSSTPRSRTS